MKLSLCDLKTGGAGVVDEIREQGQRGRLEELGFTRGAAVRCLYEAPKGNPRAYLIRGAVIALRNGDAAAVGIRHG